jgi:hypothetical protein
MRARARAAEEGITDARGEADEAEARAVASRSRAALAPGVQGARRAFSAPRATVSAFRELVGIGPSSSGKEDRP